LSRSVDSPADAPFARLEAAREELAKAWLQGIIERAPLDDVGQLPVAEIAREAPELIVEILRDATGAPGGEPGQAAGDRLAEIARVRTPPAAVHRDLAALHTLLIGSLRRELQEREQFARGVERLAEIFGSLQAGLGESLGGAPPAAAPAVRDEEAGPGEISELYDQLRRLVAAYRRYGHPFAVLSVDVEGLGRINKAYGAETGDRMLDAVGAILEREIREVDHAFRVAEDDFCVLAPYHDARGVLQLAERLRSSVAASVEAGTHPVSLAVGIASCPEHGESAVQLLDAAQEATYAAKAAGAGVAISNGIMISPRDPSVQPR
jgi:diguanylate cyclase (GGDEF)-like protein